MEINSQSHKADHTSGRCRPVLLVIVAVIVQLFAISNPLALAVQEAEAEEAKSKNENEVAIDHSIEQTLPPKELNWQPLSEQDRIDRVQNGLQGMNLDAAEIQSLTQLFTRVQDQQEDAQQVILRVQMNRWSEQLQERFAELREYRDQVQRSAVAGETPSVLDSPFRWTGDQVRLNLGCQLAIDNRYDEALLVLNSIRTSQVVFPSQLLFYRGLVNYKLMNFQAAVQDLDLLMKQQDQLDRRTITLTQLMLSDIPESDEASLAKVVKMMDEAVRRQMKNQAGERVLQGEEDIVAMLDEMIQQKEEQQKQQQQQQQQSQAKSSPSKPSDRSMRAPLLGKGEVDPKKMTAQQWGNLPPEKQAEVIAEMSRQMPPHYKKVIEEYFRRLAEESKR